MALGTFVQALRKEAALSGTFMKGRSLMLNGAVLSFEDSGSRFSKNVTVEGTVRGSRGDLYKTHVELDVDEHEVIDYDCDCPAAYRYPGIANTPSPRHWRIWMRAAPSPLRACARRFARLRRRPSNPRVLRPPRRQLTPTFLSRRRSPRARAS